MPRIGWWSDPKRSSRRYVEAVQPDLVVMGSHGRRGLSRLVLGSVAESTVRHAPCSVLVVRNPSLSADQA